MPHSTSTMAEMPAPTEAPVLPDVEFVVAEDTEAELDPPHHVIIHNDDITPMDFVTKILTGIFELSFWDATAVMLRAHFKGQALVMTTGLEDAKYRVSMAHQRARANQYPLTFTIEPAE